MATLPPGLMIDGPASSAAGKRGARERALIDTRDALRRLAQYLQSNMTDDKESSWEYKDAAGQTQGPFEASQLKEWQNAVSCFLLYWLSLKLYTRGRDSSFAHAAPSYLPATLSNPGAADCLSTLASKSPFSQSSASLCCCCGY